MGALVAHQHRRLVISTRVFWNTALHSQDECVIREKHLFIRYYPTRLTENCRIVYYTYYIMLCIILYYVLSDPALALCEGGAKQLANAPRQRPRAAASTTPQGDSQAWVQPSGFGRCAADTSGRNLTPISSACTENYRGPRPLRCITHL